MVTVFAWMNAHSLGPQIAPTHERARAHTHTHTLTHAHTHSLTHAHTRAHLQEGSDSHGCRYEADSDPLLPDGQAQVVRPLVGEGHHHGAQRESAHHLPHMAIVDARS